MSGITIQEFELLVAQEPDGLNVDGSHSVPPKVFNWLQAQCLQSAERGEATWMRLTQRRGRVAVQVTSFVGVIRAVDGFQIEVLPKIGKAMNGSELEARQLLIEMLRCLGGFRHIQTESTKLLATRMPLLEVFIAEFLRSVAHVVKRGIRCDYITCQENLFTLRGKLQLSQHLRQNLCRADRFFTEHDEFTTNRPENRLLHTALRCVLSFTASQESQRLARELRFAFSDVPESVQVAQDFQRIRLERGMDRYADALAWARLILNEASPSPGQAFIRLPRCSFPWRRFSKHMSPSTWAASW